MRKNTFLFLTVLIAVNCVNETQNSIEIPKIARGQWYDINSKDKILVCTLYADGIIIYNYDNNIVIIPLNQKLKLVKKQYFGGDEYFYFFEIPESEYFVMFYDMYTIDHACLYIANPSESLTNEWKGLTKPQGL